MRLIYHLMFLSVIFGIVFYTGYYFYGNLPSTNASGESICGDGTVYEQCSARKPYYCSDGLLYERASICGCPEGLEATGDLCVSQYLSGERNVYLDYTLNGNDKKIEYPVYEEMVSYVSNLQKSIISSGEGGSSRLDFKLDAINEPQQRALLEPLVVKIQNMDESQLEQARIAVNLVQNIDYGFSDKEVRFGGFTLNYSRYPYEVLSDNQGICGEKSELLAFLLKELGYGVAIFYNPPENHESVGIKCPMEESWKNTGYCFIETSGPAIISDSEIIYVGGVKILSTPQVLVISDGDSLPPGIYEYEDADTFSELRKRLTTDGINLIEQYKYNSLKRKYGLADSYNLI